MKTMIAFLVVSFCLLSPGLVLADVDEVATNEGGSVEFIECGPMDEATAPLQVAQRTVCLANPDGSCMEENATCTQRRIIAPETARCATQTLPITGKKICRCQR